MVWPALANTSACPKHCCVSLLDKSATWYLCEWVAFTSQAWFAFYVLRGSVADGELGTAPQRPGGYIGSLNPGQFTGSVLKVQRRGPVMRPAWSCPSIATVTPWRHHLSADGVSSNLLSQGIHLHVTLWAGRFEWLRHLNMQAAGSLGLTRGGGGAGGGNPFFRLLRAYLQHFLPRPAPGALTPPRPGSE